MYDKKDNIVIIDGNSLVNRAYFAIQRPMITSDGFYTQGIYGFLSMLQKIQADLKPTHMLVAFDRKAPTFRHLEYEGYKAGRKGMPDELAMEMPVLKDVLHANGIRTYEIDGFEADDIMGTVAKLAESEGLRCNIVTGDKDALQLASDMTSVIITKKGISEFKLYDEEAMQEEYGFSRSQFIDFKALKGDSSDNIPGVPGVGDKTAQKLILQFGSVENLLSHTGEIENAKLRAKIEDNAQMALFSKRLATIVTSVPLDFSLEDTRLKPRDLDELTDLYSRLEFRTHLAKILKEKERQEQQLSLFGATPEEGSKQANGRAEASEEDTAETAAQGSSSAPGAYEQGSDKALASFRTADDRGSALVLLEKAIASGDLYCEFDGSADHLKAPVIEAFRFICGEEIVELRLGAEVNASVLREALSGRKIRLAGSDLGKLYYCLIGTGTDISGLETAFDCALAQYVIAPGSRAPETSQLILEHFKTAPSDKERLLFIRELRAIQEDTIEQLDLSYVLYEIELPLCKVLASMEALGIKLDSAELESFGKELKKGIAELESEIYELAGERFNINSPKQLGTILFEKLALPWAKKTKSGYSTNAEVLEKLAPDYPIVEKVLEYRTLSKLNSTYVEGLLPLIAEDGKVHAHFQQTVTSTGRLSCTDPNLQNIPVRTELGRQLRRAFTADSGDYVLIGADYSQIELRVLAHMSGDETLIECFRSGLDIHRETASKVFGVPFDEVSPQMRSNAKAVNFGVIYGMSGFGLATELTITRKQAEKYIADYFTRFSSVKTFMNGCIDSCKRNGYIRTLFGRLRRIPEINSSMYMQRQLGERLAMNTPIQGTAADIIKLAMIKVHERLESECEDSHLILTIHDELIIHALRSEADRVRDMLVECMEDAAQLAVKLEVSLEEGNHWYELK